MAMLHNDWITSGLIDFEYKKYVLLAYLQKVNRFFDAQKLYPLLSDLIFHYQNVLTLRENKKLMYEHFPKSISKADFNKLQVSYRSLMEDSALMAEIESIIDFALPRIKEQLDTGKELYEYFARHIDIQPVGIRPLHQTEGYLFLLPHTANETYIYRYSITLFENAGEKFRGLNTVYIETMRRNIGEPHENIKRALIRRDHTLPNPATFTVHLKVPCPFEETFLPVAKRSVVQYLAA